MKIKRYVMVGLVCLLVLAVLPVPLSAQEDDREDMMLIISSRYSEVVTLYRVSIDGSFSQSLGEIYKPVGTSDLPLIISPDEEWILYQDPDQRLHRVRVDGTDDQLLSEGPAWAQTWSPDNRQLIFRQCDAIFDPAIQNVIACDLYAMDWMTEEVTSQRLTNLAMEQIEIKERSWNKFEREVWSPDGWWLVFSAGTRDERDLYRMNISAPGQVQQITDLPGREEFVAWSLDGQWLVFEVFPDDYTAVLYSIPMGDATANPDSAQRLTTETCQLDIKSLSQNHEWLIVAEQRCQTGGLYGLQLTGEPELVRLADSPISFEVYWIVDNETFMLRSVSFARLFHIHLNAAEPSDSIVTEIAYVHNFSDIRLSPDQEWVYFSGIATRDNSDDPTGLYRVRPDGTGIELVFEITGDVYVHSPILGFMPEDQGMYAAYRPPDGQSTGIYWVSLDGSEMHPVVEWFSPFSPGDFRVSPDGQWVYFSESLDDVGIEREWYVASLNPSAPESSHIQPLTLPYGFDSPRFGVQWSPDGNWLLWSGETYLVGRSPHSQYVFRSRVGSPELELVHQGLVVRWIRASR